MWMIVGSSTPVPHTTGFNRRELERLVKEADDGFFDPEHLPKRHGSRFLSPFLQRLLDLAQTEPLGAAQQLLSSLTFDQVAWDPQAGCLSLRQRRFGADGVEHEWLQLWLRGSNDEQEQSAARGQAAGGGAATIQGLWSQPLAIEEGPARIEVDGLRDQIRAVTAAVQQEFIDPLIADGTVPPGTTLECDESQLRDQPTQDWQDEPLPFEQLPEPVAVGQVYKHRLRARWVVVQYVDEKFAMVGPVDAVGAPTRGRRATVTLEPGGRALKMYDRVYPGGPGRADL